MRLNRLTCWSCYCLIYCHHWYYVWTCEVGTLLEGNVTHPEFLLELWIDACWILVREPLRMCCLCSLVMGCEVNIRYILGKWDQTDSGSCAVAGFGFTNGKPSDFAASAWLHFICYISYLKEPWIVIVPAPWLSGLDLNIRIGKK